MRPQWTLPPIHRDQPARDLLLLVDLSGSMDTADFTDAQAGR
jgi:Ca-activated chloride channel family protein